MRSVPIALCVPLGIVLLLALAGCKTMSAVGEDLEQVVPASQADVAEQVDRLRADHDAAIQAVGAAAASAVAQLRADADAADAQIRADTQAAHAAQDAAFQRAAAEGKTWMEAQLTASAARIEQAAKDAKDAAGLAATKSDEAKVHADKKVAEISGTLSKAAQDAQAAREETEGGLPWWGVVLLGIAGLFPAGWGVKKIATGVVIPLIRAGIDAFDKQPFEGAGGERVTEEQLVARLGPPPPGKAA